MKRKISSDVMGVHSYYSTEIQMLCKSEAEVEIVEMTVFGSGNSGSSAMVTIEHDKVRHKLPLKLLQSPPTIDQLKKIVPWEEKPFASSIPQQTVRRGRYSFFAAL